TIETMLFFHDRVEETRAGRDGLLCNAGKYWVNSTKLGTTERPMRLPNGAIAAANYGFFPRLDGGVLAPKGPAGVHDAQGWSHGPGTFAVWQNVGCAHDLTHVDYSQTVRLVSRRGLLDGAVVRDLADVAQDLELCGLVSDEGPVLMRHPAIPLQRD